MPHGADFELRLKKSTLDCSVKRTLDATAVVDFVPRGVDLGCKNEKHFPESKSKKNRENE
jgi:hypothetical protein